MEYGWVAPRLKANVSHPPCEASQRKVPERASVSSLLWWKFESLRVSMIPPMKKVESSKDGISSDTLSVFSSLTKRYKTIPARAACAPLKIMLHRLPPSSLRPDEADRELNDTREPKVATA